MEGNAEQVDGLLAPALKAASLNSEARNPGAGSGLVFHRALLARRPERR